MVVLTFECLIKKQENENLHGYSRKEHNGLKYVHTLQ
jgi:hypothetical protein